jgi:hypothetical protein
VAVVAAAAAAEKEAGGKEEEEPAPHNRKRRFLMLRYTHLHQGIQHMFHMCSTRSSLFRHMSNQNRLGLNMNTDRTVFWLHHRTSMAEEVVALGPLVLLHLKQLTLYSDQ